MIFETQGLDFLDIDWYLNHKKDNSKFYGKILKNFSS